MTDLPSLRQTLDAHGLLAKKSFGQHFLLDLNVTRKIVRLAGPFEGRAVIEVGPGPGGLTRALLESDAGPVVLVEKDPRFIPLLSELDDGSGRLIIVEADALKVKEADLVSGPAHMVSNLPYNVGTALFTRWLEPAVWPPRWLSLTLMFQLEVAERIVAARGKILVSDLPSKLTAGQVDACVVYQIIEVIVRSHSGLKDATAKQVVDHQRRNTALAKSWVIARPCGRCLHRPRRFQTSFKFV